MYAPEDTLDEAGSRYNDGDEVLDERAIIMSPPEKVKLLPVFNISKTPRLLVGAALSPTVTVPPVWVYCKLPAVVMVFLLIWEPTVNTASSFTTISEYPDDPYSI